MIIALSKNSRLNEELFKKCKASHKVDLRAYVLPTHSYYFSGKLCKKIFKKLRFQFIFYLLLRSKFVSYFFLLITIKSNLDN